MATSGRSTAARSATAPTDGVKGNQVFKFSPDGKLLLTLGNAGVSKAGPTRSCSRRRAAPRRTATS